MRRPTLCCDRQSTTAINEQTCKEQGGTLARVRRLFFSTSLSRKSSSSGGITSQSLKPQHGPSLPSRRSALSFSPPPPLRLNFTMATIQQEMIGMPLEEYLLRGDANSQGVPHLVYELCSYILNHEVNCAALIYEDWDSEEIRATLSLHHRTKTVDSTSVAQLLRYYVEELPQPLLPPHTVTALLPLAERCVNSPDSMLAPDNVFVECRARKLMARDLTEQSMRMVRYLTAFLSCLHHANRCEREGAGILLSSALVGGGHTRRTVGRCLALYFLQHCSAIFPEDRESVDRGVMCALEPMQHSSDTSSNAATASHDEDDSSEAVLSTANEFEDEDSSSSNSSSRTTSSGDTEDYLSPQLSPPRLPVVGGHEYVLLPEGDLLSPDDMLVSPADNDDMPQPSVDALGMPSGHSSSQSISGYYDLTPAYSGEAGSQHFQMEEGIDKLSDEECKNGYSSSSSRSTNIGDLTGGSLSFSCDLKDKEDNNLLLLHRQDLLNKDASDTALEESDGTNCPLSDPWEDFTTTSGGELYTGGGVSSEDPPLYNEVDSDLRGEVHLVGESARFSERTYYPKSSTAVKEHTSSSSSHRSKKKKSKHRRHSKDSGPLWGNSDNREKITASPTPQSQSEDEDTLVPHISGNDTSTQSKNSLSSLFDHNEPVVASDRARWNVDPQPYDHSDAPLRYSCYAEPEVEPMKAESSSSWFKFQSASSGSQRSMRSPSPDLPVHSDMSYNHHRFDQLNSSSSHSTSTSSSSNFMRAVTGKTAIGVLQKNISSLKKKIKKFEEEFEIEYGYKPSHSDKMKYKETKKHMTDLNKYRKELKMLKEGVADLMSSKGFSLSLLRCQESTQNNPSVVDNSTQPSTSASSTHIPSTIDHKTTLLKVEERLKESRSLEGRPQELASMNTIEMQEEKTSLQKALLYYESIHGRPNSKETRELARPLYDRYRQVKRNVSRAQSRAKENINELAPIIEHVAMDFTLASPQHRSSLVPDTTPVEQLLQCKEKLLAVQKKQQMQLQQEGYMKSTETDEAEDEEDNSDKGLEGSLSDSSDVSKQSSTALSNLHSLPLHELKERRKEAKEQKKKLRRSLRHFEERYEREHGHKLAKEDRGVMEQTYGDYKHAKAKLRLLEALISKKAPREDEF